MKSCLSVCGKARVSRHHLSTASHRDAQRRRENRLQPVMPAALYGLRNWARQYDLDDPGNSPEWDAAQRAS